MLARLLFVLVACAAACTPAAAQRPPSSYDVFVVAGQSNAQGRGDSTLSPPIAEGVAYLYESGVLVPLLSDPVGDASTGSAWPSFINSYHERSGRGVVLVEAAVGGSAVVPAANPERHWAAGGGLFEDADAWGNAAFEAARTAGLDPLRGGWLWCQGETDADAIEDDVITPADYTAGMLDLLDRYADTAFGQASARFFVLRTGRRRRRDGAGFRAVRTVQDSLRLPAVMAFTGAVTFPDRGLMRDDIHWSQDGLNEAGRETANVVNNWVVANEPPPLPTLPALTARVVPHPARRHAAPALHVGGLRGGPVRVEVSDLLGRRLAVVYDGPAAGGAPLVVPLPPLDAGRYVVWVVQDERRADALFVVE